MDIPFDLQTFVIAAATVGAAYVVFGISAFGAGLFTVPILSYLLPLDFVLPLCVLLDVSAALTLGARFSRAADKLELMLADRLIAFALAGLWIGNRLQGRLTRAALLRFVSALLFLIGLSLLVRALTGG